MIEELLEPELDPVLEPLESTSRRAGLIPLSLRLHGLRRLVKPDLVALEAALDEIATPRGELHSSDHAAAWLLGRAGKRLRPVCVMLAARLGGRASPEAVRSLALAAELVHAATLLHDDVIDEGTERRGVPTARVVYGNSASVLAGDHLLVTALRHVEASGVPRALPDLLAAIAEMVHAEAIQLDLRGRFEPDRGAYLRVARGKTAALFRWCVTAGGGAGGLADAHVASLAKAGVALGVSFQLVDDALDLDGDPAETGKDPFADLREGKMTWPVLVASERDPALARDLRARAVESGTGAATDDLVRRIRATGAVDATRSAAREHAAVARSALAALPGGRARDALLAVVDAAIDRSR